MKNKKQKLPHGGETGSMMTCICPRKCIRHGKCDECRAFKIKKNMLPYCERKKKTKDEEAGKLK